MTGFSETRTLRSDKCFDELASLLVGLSDDHFLYYCPSPGNWGDGLINHGASQFFHEKDIRPLSCRRQELRDLIGSGLLPAPPSSSVLIVGGGGGWCENWFSTRDFVQEMSGLFNKIVIMPTSFYLPAVQSDGAEIIYFSRDGFFSDSTVSQGLFCHDMAFYVSKHFDLASDAQSRLVCLRNDREKSPAAKPFWNSVDLSSLGNSYQSVDSFFGVLGNFQHVVTDRLHVAIASGLMGIPSQLLPGNYAKARMVWEASISGNYKMSTFVEWDDFDFY